MIIGVMVSSSFAHAQSCKCEALVCDACEVQVGVDFYTESCDGGKTKSCQKPRCELPKNLAKGCEGRAGGIAGNDSSKGHDEASSKTENSPRIVESHRSAGVLVIARGSVTVISPMGKETGALTREARDPSSRPALMAAQCFEFPHGPSSQGAVDMCCHSVKS